MKKEVMVEWVAALRSGKYEQGFKMLKSGNTFCCLGVLCDISPPALDWFGAAPQLNSAIKHWSGMVSGNGNLDDITCLTKLNDSEGYDFAAIADLIEERWEDL